MSYSHYIPLCDALVLLMDPLIEIVIHDIEHDQIAYINGKLSGRQVGDSSLLDPTGLDDVNHVIYPKINLDGRLIKSISVQLDKRYLLCINCDISIFCQLQELSSALLQTSLSNKPTALFKRDWKETLHVSVHAYLQNNNLKIETMSLKEKKQLAYHLFELGAFEEKQAVDYISLLTKLGRSTLFNYLKEWRAA